PHPSLGPVRGGPRRSRTGRPVDRLGRRGLSRQAIYVCGPSRSRGALVHRQHDQRAAIDAQPEDIMSSVLIVDDEAPIREFLTRWLRKSNYETTEAADAEAALALVSEQQPDVVLCDVHMPGRDGLWLMEQLRGRFPRIAIVLATANDDVPPAEIGRASGRER